MAEEDLINNTYIALRYIEGICVAVFVFGFLWEGAEVLKLSLPEFMMLYGGLGAVLSELFSRFIRNSIKKKDIKKGK